MSNDELFKEFLKDYLQLIAEQPRVFVNTPPDIDTEKQMLEQCYEWGGANTVRSRVKHALGYRGIRDYLKKQHLDFLGIKL